MCSDSAGRNKTEFGYGGFQTPLVREILLIQHYTLGKMGKKVMKESEPRLVQAFNVVDRYLEGWIGFFRVCF